MRIIESKIYQLKELDEKAQEKAYNNWLQYSDYPWASENEETLKAFCDLFPVQVTDWEYDLNHKHLTFRFTEDDTIENLSGIRLLKHLSTILQNYHAMPSPSLSRKSRVFKDNCCILTGYCMDEEILEPIYDFMKKPNEDTTYDLLRSCLQNWLSACQKDLEDYSSFKSFQEMADINNWEFYANGDIYIKKE